MTTLALLLLIQLAAVPPAAVPISGSANPGGAKLVGASPDGAKLGGAPANPTATRSARAAEYVRLHRRASTALVSGVLGEARSGFEQCLALSPENPTVAYALACTEARDQHARQALEWLGRAVAWGYLDADVARWDADLELVRGEPRFQAACNAMDQASGRITRRAGLGARGLVRLWDERDGELALDVAVDPQGRFVAVGLTGGFLQLLDARTGRERHRSEPLGSDLIAVEFDPAGERLFALGFDGTLRVSAADGGGTITTLAALPPPDRYEELRAPGGAALRFSADGSRLLVAQVDRGTCLVRTAPDGDGPAEPALLRAFPDRRLRALPAWGGAGLFALATEARVEVRDAADAALRLRLDIGASVWSLAFSPDGATLATGSSDLRAELWDLARPELPRSLFGEDEAWPWDRVVDLALSPDGRWLAAATLRSGDVVLFDIASNAPASRSAARTPLDDSVLGRRELAWSLDSSRVWFSFAGGPRRVAELPRPGEAPSSLRYFGRAPRISPTGLAAAACGRSVLALDAGTGAPRWNRPVLARPGEIVASAAGYFTTTFDDLDGLVVERGWSSSIEAADDLLPAAECAETLYDPKRVRAERLGVRVLPPRF